MPSEVILPRVDMDMTTGRIAKWLVEAGTAVAKGQPLFEIETDKAAMEIEAPSSGIIRDMAEPSAAAIPVGSVVAWIYAENEPPAARPTAAVQAPDGIPPVAAVAPAPAPRPGPDPAAGRPRATPMARRLAREHGLDLSALRGSGPRGRIQAQDVVARAEAPPSVIADRPDDRAGGRAAQTTSPASTPLICLREGSGTPLLLVHGFAADAGNWRPFLSGRDVNRPVYAIDLPGHGTSPHDATTLTGLADALEAALSAAALPAIDLVGHSLGAAVAACTAARGTLDIRSLLLLSPAGLGPEINAAVLRGLLAARSEASLTPWMQRLVTEPGAITPAFVRSTLRAREGTALAARQQAMADALFADDTQTFSIRADLMRLGMPTRVVVGVADAIFPSSHTRDLPGLVALHRLPGVGHLPHFEARAAVWTIVEQMAR